MQKRAGACRDQARVLAVPRQLDRVTARTKVVPRKPFRPCGGRALCFLEVRSVNEMVIGMIGAGNMADALIKGLLSRRVLPPDAIWATNRSNRERQIGRASCRERAAGLDGH